MGGNYRGFVLSNSRYETFDAAADPPRPLPYMDVPPFNQLGGNARGVR